MYTLEDRNIIPVAIFRPVITGSNYTTTHALGCAFKTLNGQWFLHMNVRGSLSVADNNFDLTMAGVDWIFGGITQQTITISDNTVSGSTQAGYCHSTNTIRLAFSANTTDFGFSGIVALDAKPDFIE